VGRWSARLMLCSQQPMHQTTDSCSVIKFVVVIFILVMDLQTIDSLFKHSASMCKTWKMAEIVSLFLTLAIIAQMLTMPSL